MSRHLDFGGLFILYTWVSIELITVEIISVAIFSRFSYKMTGLNRISMPRSRSHSYTQCMWCGYQVTVRSRIKAAISSSSLSRSSYLMVIRTSNKMRLRPGLLLWLQLQVHVVMVMDADRHNNYAAPSVINVGLLQPLEGPLGFERTGSAASMAVRDAQSRGYLNQTHVKYSSIHCLSLSVVLAVHTGTHCDRLLASMRQSVCNAVHCGSQGRCILSVKLYPPAGKFLFVPSDAFAVESIV